MEPPPPPLGSYVPGVIVESIRVGVILGAVGTISIPLSMVKFVVVVVVVLVEEGKDDDDEEGIIVEEGIPVVGEPNASANLVRRSLTSVEFNEEVIDSKSSSNFSLC